VALRVALEGLFTPLLGEDGPAWTVVVTGLISKGLGKMAVLLGGLGEAPL